MARLMRTLARATAAGAVALVIAGCFLAAAGAGAGGAIYVTERGAEAVVPAPVDRAATATREAFDQLKIRQTKSATLARGTLMSKATTIGDTLRIQDQLQQVQLRIEQIQGELRRRLLRALDIEECRGQRLVSRKEMLQNLHA